VVQWKRYLKPGPFSGVHRVYFEIVDEITDVEVIAVGGGIGRRKMKIKRFLD